VAASSSRRTLADLHRFQTRQRDVYNILVDESISNNRRNLTMSRPPRNSQINQLGSITKRLSVVTKNLTALLLFASVVSCVNISQTVLNMMPYRDNISKSSGESQRFNTASNNAMSKESLSDSSFIAASSNISHNNRSSPSKTKGKGNTIEIKIDKPFHIGSISCQGKYTVVMFSFKDCPKCIPAWDEVKSLVSGNNHIVAVKVDITQVLYPVTDNSKSVTAEDQAFCNETQRRIPSQSADGDNTTSYPSMVVFKPNGTMITDGYYENGGKISCLEGLFVGMPDCIAITKQIITRAKVLPKRLDFSTGTKEVIRKVPTSMR
jgi:thioredoxin-related protein